MTYPGNLNSAVVAAIARLRQGSLRDGMADLTARYRRGGQSKGADLASYLAARLPATFAVSSKVMADVAARFPNFEPSSLLDVGAGPGTAGWAALQQWPALSSIQQMEAAADLGLLAKDLNLSSGIEALQNAVLHNLSITAPLTLPPVDLVLASYVLAEIQAPAMHAAVSNLLAVTANVLVVVEPGTPLGFAHVLAVRNAGLKRGFHIIGPCTHALTCPMKLQDWCHFKTRVQRSRDHMHAKSAVVPFEDEPYAWVALSRKPLNVSGARVIAPPVHSKPGLDLQLCRNGEIITQRIASRDKATYKAMKKTLWGDWVGIES